MLDMIAQMATFSEFRKRDSLEAYTECAREFHFDDFDSEFNEHEPELYTNAVAFVSQRLADFVI